jgi:hypothetical protein
MSISRWLVGVFGLAAIFGLAGAVAGQVPANATALEGVPTVRIDTTQETATRRELARAEAATSLLKIQIIDGRYYWASHGNRPLTVSTSGDFTYLASTEPGRYVRFRRLNDRLTYVEHVDMPSGSVTYWGELRIVLGK